MKHVLALTAALALASCDQPNRGADKHVFQQAEWFRPDGPITFIVHPTLTDLRAKAPASAKREGEELMAWSIISTSPTVPCRVHIVDPRVAYKPEWIGHEITHCVYGRWHK